MNVSQAAAGFGDLFAQVLDPAHRADPYPLYARLRERPAALQDDGTYVVEFKTSNGEALAEGPSGARKTTMIVALARKLLIALWRLVTTGEVPDGVELRTAA